MINAGFHLGLDYGTTNTVALLRWPDGRVRPLLVDGSPLLPSAVFAAADGSLLVGRDAERAARSDPARFEPNPKRHIDAGSVLLGERSVPVVDLIAAVLRRVYQEAVRTAGVALTSVALTHPAAWGGPRRALLGQAAAHAGLPQPVLVAEPTAAASYFVGVLRQQVGLGQSVVVYDLGAGTFDSAVVRRTGTGFEVLAVGGLDDVGGVDLDRLVLDLVGEVVGRADPDSWQRLTNPRTIPERRYFAAMRDEVRDAKEMLSRAAQAEVHVPLAERQVHVTREQFEQAASALLARTVDATAATVARSGVGRSDLAGLILVGGSSRIPLVATLLHRGLGITPIVVEQPETVVAEGAAHLLGAGAQPGGPQTAPTAVAGSEPTLADAPPADRPAGSARWRRPAMLAAGAAAAAVVALAGYALWPDGGQPTDNQGSGPTPTASVGPQPTGGGDGDRSDDGGAGSDSPAGTGMSAGQRAAAFRDTSLRDFAGGFHPRATECVPATEQQQEYAELGTILPSELTETVRCTGQGWVAYFYLADAPAVLDTIEQNRRARGDGSSDFVDGVRVSAYQQWVAPSQRLGIYWEPEVNAGPGYLAADFLHDGSDMQAARDAWVDLM